MWRDRTESEVADALASIDITVKDPDLYIFQCRYLAGNDNWFSLGWHDDIEYGVNNGALNDFTDKMSDDDEEKLILTPTEPGKIETHYLECSWSLHRIIEAPSPPHPAYQAPTRDQSPNKTAAPSDSSSVQPGRTSGHVPSCERVLSRFIQVGRLFTRRKGARPRITRFMVLKALGPPDCVGFWIIGFHAYPDSVEEPGSPSIMERVFTDSEMAELRRDRRQFLEGFSEQISYARIKPDEERKVFELVDSSASSFVISRKFWLTE